MRRTICTALALTALLLSSASLRAVDLVLEPEDPTVKNLKRCDTVHVLSTCESRHYIPPNGAVGIGAIVFLDDEPFIVLWIGPAYYLESGVVLHPVDGPAPRLAGQQWIEAYPQPGRRHVSRVWADLNGDGLLNRTDRLQFETGRIAKIRDVRPNLRVRPLQGQ